MRIVVTDPVREDITREVDEFEKQWTKIGQEIKLQLQIGNNNLTWCNIGVTHDADCIDKCTYHRTIAVLRS